MERNPQQVLQTSYIPALIEERNKCTSYVRAIILYLCCLPNQHTYIAILEEMQRPIQTRPEETEYETPRVKGWLVWKGQSLPPSVARYVQEARQREGSFLTGSLLTRSHDLVWALCPAAI